MAKYINSFTSTTTTLLSNSDKQYTGNIHKIHISNNDTTTETISVYITDGTTNTYLIKGLVVPGSTSLVLEDCIPFNISTHSLKIDHESSPNLSIILK